MTLLYTSSFGRLGVKYDSFTIYILTGVTGPPGLTGPKGMMGNTGGNGFPGRPGLKGEPGKTRMFLQSIC